MTRHANAGTTLVEFVVMLGIITLVLGAVVGVSLQSHHIYRTSSGGLQPQGDGVLALTRIERDIIQAMALDNATCRDTTLGLILPAKDSQTALYEVSHNAGPLALEQGTTVFYFLGTRTFPDSSDRSHWFATPSDSGDTLFRVEDQVAVNGAYANAPVILEHIDYTPPTGGSGTTPIFRYEQRTEEDEVDNEEYIDPEPEEVEPPVVENPDDYLTSGDYTETDEAEEANTAFPPSMVTVTMKVIASTGTRAADSPESRAFSRSYFLRNSGG